MRCCRGRGVFMCLQSWQGLPQWILSHFLQTPPLTDHAAAFKRLNWHQRQLWDFAFLSEHYNLWSFPDMKKNSASLLPSPLCYDFTKTTHSEGFSGSARIMEGTPNHLFSTQNTVCYQPLHRTHVPPIGKGRGTAPDNTMECINGCAAPCSAHNIIYSSVRGEITAAILFWRKKSSWPGNT